MKRILLTFAAILLLGGAALAAGNGVGSMNELDLNGSSSGTAAVGVPAAAGSPNKINLPTTTGTSGQVLSTDGANPQQTSWVTVTGTGTVTSIATSCGLAGGTITSTGTLKLSETVNAQTGTSYTTQSTDCGKLVTQSNASASAYTLLTPATAGSGYVFDFVNLGAGTATLTPASGTINGLSSVALTTRQGARVVTDGTNYFAVLGQSSGGGGGSITVTDGSNTQTTVTTVSLGQGLTTTAGSSGTAPINLTAPDRNATSGTIAASDMAGQVNATTGITIPAVSSTVFATGMTSIITAPNGSVTVSSTPTINGCGVAGTIFQGGFMALVSNGTSLDCAGFPGFGALSQDVTSTAAGVATISASAVTTGKINAAAVTLAKQATNTANTLQGFDNGGAAADVAVGSGLALSSGTLSVTGGATGITFTDGTHTVASATQLTVTGGTVGGTTPNATLTVSGGSGCTVSGGAGLVLNNGSSACTTDTNIQATAGALSLGASGTAGSVAMGNATSGTITLQPVTGALGSVTVSIPAATDTLVNLAGAQTLSNKTMVAPALGTPTSATLTNATGLPAASVVAGALASGMTATTQSAKDNSTKVATTAYVDRPTGLTTGTSVTLAAPRQYFICTGTCTITVPVPAAGYEFCVIDNVAVSSVITINNPGSSVQFGKTDQSAYGTASTGTMVSDGSTVGSKVCLGGIDSTHYNVLSSNGTWTNS